MYINETKKRAMKFGVFNSKFQNMVNILDSYGRTMHNEDFVDLLWTKLNNGELKFIVASIKVDYCCNRQKHTNILQEIDTQIQTGKIPPFTTAGVLEFNKGVKNKRNTSACP